MSPITKDTAWALYSCVNLRRVEPMVLHSFGQERHNLVSTKPGTVQSALTRACLERRIGDIDVLNAELAAWQQATNTDQRQVNWHFTTDDARIKLRHLYPEH